jgi:hypothetical protein
MPPWRHSRYKDEVWEAREGGTAPDAAASQDPMALDPAAGGDPKKISQIQVISTHLGGQQTGKM